MNVKTSFLNFLKNFFFFLGYVNIIENIKETINFFILQTLWESYF